MVDAVRPRVYSDMSLLKNGYYPYEPKKDEKKSHALGITIAASSVVVGFGTLALMKGFVPKALTKYLDKWKLVLEKKLETGTDFQGLYKKALDFVNDTRSKSKSINNITSLKDVLFERLMCGKNGNRPITSKIHRGITKLFNRISRNTVNSSYANTERNFASLNELLSLLNQRLLSENPANKEIITQIQKNLSKVNSEYEKGFGLNARSKRLQNMQKALNDLFEEFWGKSFGDIKNNFKSKNMYEAFIAEDLLKPAKEQLMKTTSSKRNAVKTIIDTVLEDYRSVLSNNEFAKLKKQVNSVLKSLDSSIETETSKYFDKARDLKLGSAPTDVLSIVTGLGAVGWFTAKAKDKDERISSVLQYGIPAIGTIATALYCNARLISGGKGMAFGLLSGLVVNKIGAFVDNMRKKYSLDISLQNKTILKPQSDTV